MRIYRILIQISIIGKGYRAHAVEYQKKRDCKLPNQISRPGSAAE